MGVVRQDGEAAFTTTSIDVNIDSLGDFGTFVRSELDANLRPGSDDVIYEHTIGVRFGKSNAGQNVRTASHTYHDALVSSTNNLFEYVHTAQTMTQLINVMLRSYRAADLTAAGSSQTIGDSLAEAIEAAYASDIETNRETHRDTGPVTHK